MLAEVRYENNDVRLPEGDFTTEVFESRFDLNFTNRKLTTALVQYETASRRLNLFLRLRLIDRKEDEVFVVFQRTSERGEAPAATERSLLVKFTRSFDL